MSNVALVLLASVTLRHEEGQDDIINWLRIGGEKFTVRSAYELASKSAEEEVSWGWWKLLLRMEATQRVKVFSWIMVHNKLLTNMDRWKRKQTADPVFMRCHRGAEDSLLAIRDCPWARGVWKAPIKPESQHEFFSLGMEDWVMLVLRARGSGGHSER